MVSDGHFLLFDGVIYFQSISYLCKQSFLKNAKKLYENP